MRPADAKFRLRSFESVNTAPLQRIYLGAFFRIQKHCALQLDTFGCTSAVLL